MLGLISATYSAVFISLAAGRIGRDVAVDWMQLATVYFGSGMISAEPTWSAVLGGLFVHESAAVLWALVFFGALWPWTRRLSPLMILAIAVPWALITSAIDYYIVLPRLQPIVPMQVPYWVALAIHLSSAAAYPLFPLAYGWLAGARLRGTRSARLWGIGLGFAVAAMAVLFALGRSGHEVALPGFEVRAGGGDAMFLRRMTAHQQVGLRLARMGATRAIHPELRTVAELVAAERVGELAIMGSWWKAWIGGAVPPMEEDEYRDMEFPPPELIDSLRAAPDSTFDLLFLDMMIRHHEAAVAVSDEALERPGDPRIDLLALSMRHSRSGQTERMRRLVRLWRR